MEFRDLSRDVRCAEAELDNFLNSTNWNLVHISQGTANQPSGIQDFNELNEGNIYILINFFLQEMDQRQRLIFRQKS